MSADGGPTPVDPVGPVGYGRLFAVFAAARALRGAARDAYLVEACAGDPGLLDEVRGLLDHDVADDAPTVDRAATVVATAAVRALEAAGAHAVPERIGRYRIVRKVAEGGMGVVYEAVAEHPKRTVALKLVRPAVATPAVLRRLELEAETLAQFSHPGLAQIYEAGTHDGPLGRQPWFAMEFVRGTRLDAWVKERAPSVEARLALAADVAEAVHHAHQRGVVHRDLKPANLLVQEDGRPKVLDFGVARITGAADGRGTVATQVGQVLGTLPYMSPEQLSGRASDVDVRTDVYALGVVLFELLCGRLPIEVDTDSLASAARRVSEEAPVPLGTLDARYRGDIETIVAKCLAKDRDDRYASAQALADDLRRHLADQPVLARPPSAAYVLRKFARRHRALAVALGGLAVTLAAAAVGGTWLAARESSARALADRRAAEAARERDASRWFAYVSAVASAAGALDAPDVGRAAEALERAPTEHRGWEWAHLRARLDDALDVGVPPPGTRYEAVVAAAGVVRCLERPTTGGDAVLVARGFDGRFGPDRERAVVPGFVTVTVDGRTWLQRVPTGVVAWRDGRVLLESATPAIRFSGLTDDGAAVWWTAAPPGERTSVTLVPLEEGAGGLPAGGVRWEVPMRDYEGCTGRTAAGPLVAYGGDGPLKLLRVEAGRALPPVVREFHGNLGTFAALDAHGRTVVSTAADSSIVVSAVDDGAVRLRVPGRRDETRGARFSPDGTRLVTWGDDGGVRLRDASTGAVVATLLGHRGRVLTAAYAPDGATVCSLGDDGVLRGFDAHASDVGDFAAEGHALYAYDVRASPRGDLVASAGWDGTVRVWDATTLRPVAVRRATAPGPAYAVAWSPDGGRLASIVEEPGAGPVLRVDDLRAGTEAVLPAGATPTRSLAFLPDGVLVAGTPSGVALFPPGGTAPVGHLGETPARALGASRDGRLVAVLRTELEVWDVARRERRATFPAPDIAPGGVTFTPDGGQLVAAFHDGTVHVHDLGTGRHREFRVSRGRALAVAVSPDGRRVFAGGDDARLGVWDLERLELVHAVPAHRWYVHGIDVSGDGRTVYTCSGDGAVRAWSDIPRGVLHRRLRAGAPAPVALPARLLRGA